MRLRFTVFIVALLAAPCVAQARGGGGVEYFTNAGPDLLGAGVSSGLLLPFGTETVQGLSGFGYGITRGGWKIGGFGTFFFTLPVSVPIAALGGTLQGAMGGFGGIISGGHARWGPGTFALNMRLGVGGIGVQYEWLSSGAARTITDGSVVLYAAAEAEIGLVVVPAMMISVHGGMDALVTLSYVVVPVAVPTMGVRITWGRF